MKRYIVTQTGVREHDIDRTFVIEVPDDMNPEELSDSKLEELADDAGIEWEDCDCINIEFLGSHFAELPADGTSPDLTVIEVEA